jgi:hypothetical protein
MRPRALVSLAALTALLLSAGRASAEEYNGVLARMLFGVAGGPFTVPGVATMGAVGFDFQFGAQFNKLVGAYLAVAGEVVLGKVPGTNNPMGLLVDFTFNETIAVGIGPEVSIFAHDEQAPDRANFSGLLGDGILGGARLHFAWFPVDSTFLNLGGRKGLTVSLDVHVLLGPPDFVTSTSSPPAPLPHNAPLLILPRLSIGYQVSTPMFFTNL